MGVMSGYKVIERKEFTKCIALHKSSGHFFLARAANYNSKQALSSISPYSPMCDDLEMRFKHCFGSKYYVDKSEFSFYERKCPVCKNEIAFADWVGKDRVLFNHMTSHEERFDCASEYDGNHHRVEDIRSFPQMFLKWRFIR